MTDEELSALINERQRLKWELRQLTKNVESIQNILNRIDDIDRQIGI
ncbi:MAG: hypothetical protein HC830_04095 [Bacteroidetes bacterium]|nr:hypothetical protein [Bacteroidota bacterium]